MAKQILLVGKKNEMTLLPFSLFFFPFLFHPSSYPVIYFTLILFFFSFIFLSLYSLSSLSSLPHARTPPCFCSKTKLHFFSHLHTHGAQRSRSRAWRRHGGGLARGARRRLRHSSALPSLPALAVRLSVAPVDYLCRALVGNCSCARLRPQRPDPTPATTHMTTSAPRRLRRRQGQICPWPYWDPPASEEDGASYNFWLSALFSALSA